MWISPDRRQRCLPLGRVYIYLCLVLRALPDAFSSSPEVSQPVTRTEQLGLQILSGQCSHAPWGAAGDGVRHAFLVLLSTKATPPTALGFGGGGPVHFGFALTPQCQFFGVTAPCPVALPTLGGPWILILPCSL